MGFVDEEASPEAVARSVSKVREKAAALQDSPFFAKTLALLQAALEEINADGGSSAVGPRLLCLGIGSVESSAASACQLGLAWSLAEALEISDRRWADPQMRNCDRAVGEELGFQAADPGRAPDEGAASDGRPLVLWMPHCDRALYERVLAANVEEGEDMQVLSRLGSVVIIGNSFKVYAERDELGVVPAGTPGAATSTSLLRRLQPLTLEKPLPDYEAFPEAFNDTSLMTFRPRGS